MLIFSFVAVQRINVNFQFGSVFRISVNFQFGTVLKINVNFQFCTDDMLIFISAGLKVVIGYQTDTFFVVIGCFKSQGTTCGYTSVGFG